MGCSNSTAASACTAIGSSGRRQDCARLHAPTNPALSLAERGENLPLLLSKLRGDSRQAFVKSLQQLYDGIVNFQVEVGRGGAELFVVERGSGERYIPASRLSDGTLRYMALAAILLDPDPPPLVVIEEPELGLHPDVVLGIGQDAGRSIPADAIGGYDTLDACLVDALDRTYPSSVIVCDKHDGESVFERLESKHVAQEMAGKIQPWQDVERRRPGWQSMVRVRIFIEGGGSGEHPDEDFHGQAWRKFFVAVGLIGPNAEELCAGRDANRPWTSSKPLCNAGAPTNCRYPAGGQ